jgi:hypothetical protein
MAALLPALPAALALTGTIVQAATAPDFDEPLPVNSVVPDIDEELRDAKRRKGRQRFVSAEDTLAGTQVGAPLTLGEGGEALGI